VRTLADVERAHVLAVLASVGGNRARAAAALGIGTATLFRKLKAWRYS
jgi:DNA-binding protein Fis